MLQTKLTVLNTCVRTEIPLSQCCGDSLHLPYIGLWTVLKLLDNIYVCSKHLHYTSSVCTSSQHFKSYFHNQFPVSVVCHEAEPYSRQIGIQDDCHFQFLIPHTMPPKKHLPSFGN